MCSALGLEGTLSGLVWTRWARRLAASGWEVFRFDWRGSGESGGEPGVATIDGWDADVKQVCEWAAERAPIPTVLMGLRGGSLIASRAFQRGLGAVLALWEPPSSGSVYLAEALRRKRAMAYASCRAQPRRTTEELVAALESGEEIEVGGTVWRRDDWLKVASTEIPKGSATRPVHVVSRATLAISEPLFWQSGSVTIPDISTWEESTLRFLDEIRIPPRRARMSGPRVGLRATRQSEIHSQLQSIVELSSHSSKIVGTLHHSTTPRRVALVLTNFGHVPRHGHCGLATRLCAIAATSDIPAFRVDLPGLGDSEGQIEPDYHAWARSVREGEDAVALIQALDAIEADYGISEFIVGGLCAAAITAVFAHEVDDRIAGLLLIEPEFFCESERQSTSVSCERPSRLTRFADMKSMGGAWAKRLLGGQRSLWKYIPISQQTVQEMVWSRRHRVNTKLLEPWHHVLRRGTKVIATMAKGQLHEYFFEQANAMIAQADTSTRSTIQTMARVRIEGADHTFTDGESHDVLLREFRSWLAEWGTTRSQSERMTS